MIALQGLNEGSVTAYKKKLGEQFQEHLIHDIERELKD